MKRLLILIALGGASCLACYASSAKISGYISDAKCAASHNSTTPNAACVKGCIKAGQKPVFVDDAKQQVWSIDNPDSVKNYYGQHVSISANVDSANNSVHIRRVSASETK